MTLVDFLYSQAGHSLLLSLLTIPGFILILRRAGFSWAWSLLALLPSIGLVLVFAVLLFRRWPAIAAMEAKR
ncbi:hypothetical protein [Inquilinus sp.]|uniref:hypothetical protein n=1 Tax=Inquilinus sp. TaxID=1932117 RepID=UPI0031D108B1